MSKLLPFCTLLLMIAMLINVTARADEKPVLVYVTMPGTIVDGVAQHGMKFERFIETLTKLNVTPDFTLGRETKQAIAEEADEWLALQVKFLEENRSTLKALNEELSAAFKSNNREKYQETMQKQDQIWSSEQYDFSLFT